MTGFHPGMSPDKGAEVVPVSSGTETGVVIGSAFERVIEENRSRADLADLLGGKVKELKSAL